MRQERHRLLSLILDGLIGDDLLDTLVVDAFCFSALLHMHFLVLLEDAVLSDAVVSFNFGGCDVLLRMWSAKKRGVMTASSKRSAWK